MNDPGTNTTEDRSKSRRLHLCEPGWEPILADELGRTLPVSRHEVQAPGWVESRMVADEVETVASVAFSAQCLPRAEELHAPSISKWSEAVAARLIERFKDHHGPWRLHIYSHYFRHETEPDPSGPRRSALIATAIENLLRKKQRRLLRTRQNDMLAAWQADEALVQVALMSPSDGALSICFSEERNRLRRLLSRFPAGAVPIPPDAQAPSRAFQKLVEVERRLAMPIAAEATCVDLGSSPGGWAYVALARGASVTAIDRSPLRDDLMENPRLTFLRQDAFKWLPEEPVDWLLSDVVAFPARVIELLDTWLRRRLCRRFCVTIKFRGAEDYPRLEDVKRLLFSHGAEFCLRRLTSNRNEVTAYGYAAGTEAPSDSVTLC